MSESSLSHSSPLHIEILQQSERSSSMVAQAYCVICAVFILIELECHANASCCHNSSRWAPTAYKRMTPEKEKWLFPVAINGMSGIRNMFSVRTTFQAVRRWGQILQKPHSDEISLSCCVSDGCYQHQFRNRENHGLIAPITKQRTYEH